jgi:Protein of unknown function (DUF3567)
MNVIYNSDSYYVVEYPGQHGYELVDKRTARSTFFQGDVAANFARKMQSVIDESESAESVDEYLDSFGILLDQPVVYH